MPVIESISVTTDHTGTPRTVMVKVYDTRENMTLALESRFPDGEWREQDELGPAGAFVTPDGFHTDSPPDILGTIYLCTDFLDIETIAHEVVHAAMFVYSVDCIGLYSRAVVHMSVGNEIIAYMVGSMMSAIGAQLHDAGLYDS